MLEATGFCQLWTEIRNDVPCSRLAMKQVILGTSVIDSKVLGFVSGAA